LKRWYRHRFHNVTALSIVFFTMRWLPRFVQPPLAAVTALIFFLMLKSERRAVARNLRRVSGRRGLGLQWKVYHVFYSFCDLIVSYTCVPQASHEQLRSMLTDGERGAAAIDRCLAAGHGLIVWTAHLGNPEFASRLLEMHDRPVNVARVVEDKPAERMLRDRMSNERLRIVDLRGGARATIELLQALGRNEIVAIQGDRVYHARHSAEITFFSAPAEFPLGPFLLSQVSGAPVLPGFVVRTGWLRYRVLLGEAIPPASTGNRDEDQRAGLRQAVEFLEAQLANYYDQWVNFFNFWPVHSRD
jgi:KDO2-lipid IV(A) lauroyltransferase